MGDQVWRQKVQSHVDKEAGRTVVEGCWDVSKCFEQVKAKLLIDAARRHGYPLGILAISLRAYRWKRCMVFEGGIAADAVYPKSGIVAGSPHATFELLVYVIDAVRAMVAASPQSNISLHTDDLMFMATGDTVPQAANEFVRLGRCALREFSKLQLPFAPEKAVVLSNRQRAAQIARRRLGNMAGRVQTQVKALGVDLTMRSTKAKQTYHARMREAKNRIARMLSIRNQARPTKRIIKGSVIPAALYGAEIIEVPEDQYDTCGGRP